MADFTEMRLSDFFELGQGVPNLELVVKAYNINKGRNASMIQRSPNLSGYSELIAEVKKNMETMDKDAAIAAAIKTCIERGILVYFLEKHGSEVLNMFDEEWNLETALEVEKEEGIEIGVEKVFSLWESGMSLADVKQKIAMDKAKKKHFRLTGTHSLS